MKSRTSLTVLGTVVVALAVVPAASATVMVEVPIEEMIRQADAIVHGTVLRSGVRMAIGSGGIEPETLTLIEVREWLAGEGGSTVRVRELGGRWQGGGVHYEGTPTYRAGEQVVVFLERRDEAPRDLRTFGMVQGKFLVRPGAPGVADVVHRDVAGVAFVRWAGGRQSVQRPDQTPAMPLDAFLDYVRHVRGATR